MNGKRRWRSSAVDRLSWTIEAKQPFRLVACWRGCQEPRLSSGGRWACDAMHQRFQSFPSLLCGRIRLYVQLVRAATHSYQSSIFPRNSCIWRIRTGPIPHRVHPVDFARRLTSLSPFARTAAFRTWPCIHPPTSVKLYQDSTFCKRPGDGPTRWHSDLNMALLDCNDFVTAWIPLEPVPARKEGGSALVFASRFGLTAWNPVAWLMSPRPRNP